MSKFLKYAERCALDHQFDDCLEYYLCAVLVKGGNILSIGYNKRATNGFVEHFADVARGMRDYCLSTHAEMDAVLKVRGKTDLRGSKIYVVRIKPSGGLGLAKPCEICQHVLYNYGIKRAFYSVDNDEYGVLKVRNPANNYQ
jgi:deoxycytidylate deaminase